MKRVSRNWSEYNESLSDLPSVEIARTEWFASLKPMLPSAPLSMLEIGCSNGRYLVGLGGLVDAGEMTGIDIIPCKTPETMNFVQSDAMKLPFKDGSFDLVFSLGVLEHFKAAERAQLIKEQVRVLKPGGILMVIVPNCTPGSIRFAKTKLLDMFREFRHVALSPSDIRNEMERQQVEVSFERFLGSSLHIGGLDLTRFNPFPHSMVLSDDYAIIGKRRAVA